MHRINDQMIALSATPLGDELRIEPYAGETGVLEIGPGGRAITELAVSGGLASTGRMVPLGQHRIVPDAPVARRHELPVGDYFAPSLIVRYGRLRFGCRILTQFALQPEERPKPVSFRIRIRKDEPFVLDFSGKPEVVFMTPVTKQSFKPGQIVGIRAMLAERERGIVITGLEDTTRPKGRERFKIDDEEFTVLVYERLDPEVVIRNAKGEEVARGKMPFG